MAALRWPFLLLLSAHLEPAQTSSSDVAARSNVTVAGSASYRLGVNRIAAASED